MKYKVDLRITGTIEPIEETPPPADGIELMNTDPIFASGDWQTDYKENTNNGVGNVNIISSDSREGNNCVELTVNDFRQELITNKLTSGYYPQAPELGPQFGRFLWNTEYWLGMSIKPVGINENAGNFGMPLIQSHTVPADWDHSECCSGDNAFTVGILSGSQSPINSSTPAFAIHSNLHTPETSPYGYPNCGAFNYNAYPSDVYKNESNLMIVSQGWHTALNSVNNKWIDLVFNFIHSYQENGLMEAWVQIDGNGYQKVITQNGPNVSKNAAYNGSNCGKGVERIPYTTYSFGPYAGSNGPLPTTVRYDSIRLIDMSNPANADAGFEDVKPR